MQSKHVILLLLGLFVLPEAQAEPEICNQPPNVFAQTMPASSVPFSARWARNYKTPEEYRTAADQFGADSLVWHYPRDLKKPGKPYVSDLLDQLPRLAVKNCGLPATTRNPAGACKGADGSPAHHHASRSIYYPDTTSQVWRDEVRQAIARLKSLGCTSVFQDDFLFMWTRHPSRYKGNTCHMDGRPAEAVFEDVESYYDQFLIPELRKAFGGQVMLFGNKVIKHSPQREDKNRFNRLASRFHGFVSEISGQDINPYELYYAVHEVNRQCLNRNTVVSAVTTDEALQQRSIAMSYALGAFGLVPYDIYIPRQPRYYGDPARYRALFRHVKDHADLFDGYDTLQDVLIQDPSAPKGLFSKSGQLVGVPGQQQLAVTLRRKDPAHYALHIVNFAPERRHVTLWIDKALFPAPARPTGLEVHRPGQSNVLHLDVTDDGNKGWKVSVPGIEVWATGRLVVQS